MEVHSVERRTRSLFAGFAALTAALTSAGGSALAAPTLTVLHSFAGSPTDGRLPKNDRLFLADDGNLYGTTFFGGAGTGCGEFGCGTIFRLGPSGAFSVIHNFGVASSPARPGLLPEAGLIADRLGNFYGMTAYGGGSLNKGTVFKRAPDGTETVLYTFCRAPGCSDGAKPRGSLYADRDGNLYGTTELGGINDGGVVFRIAANGTYTVLHRFAGRGEGASPVSGLIADGLGNFYGTASVGGVLGPGCGARGCGTVFKLGKDGSGFGVLHAFAGGNREAFPFAGLISDGNGNLYGTTERGGGAGCADATLVGCGTLFKIAPDGTKTVLHAFSGGGSDGNDPTGRLIADAVGNLYGTTISGGGTGCGGKGCGTIYRLAPDGRYSVLHAFASDTRQGAAPSTGLVADSAGNLYGTTFFGGASGRGTVFKLGDAGFVPRVAFSGFHGSLAIQFGQAARTDAFQFSSVITLGSASAGVNPVAERVSLRIGTFSTVLEPGSLVGPILRRFDFVGSVGGTFLRVRIAPYAPRQYLFFVTGTGASLTGTRNPVPVTLAVGDDIGSASFTATID